MKSDTIKSDEKQENSQNESNEESDSQETSQSAILIHKRYNQSSNDKQVLQSTWDPTVKWQEKIESTITKEEDKVNNWEKPNRNRLLYSIVYKRHNQSSKTREPITNTSTIQNKNDKISTTNELDDNVRNLLNWLSEILLRLILSYRWKQKEIFMI